MKLVSLTIGVFFWIISIHSFAQNKQNLEGFWRFGLDRENRGLKEKWFEKDLTQTIHLPGTTDEAKYGTLKVGSHRRTKYHDCGDGSDRRSRLSQKKRLNRGDSSVLT
jgi:hypothetical protein